MNRPLIAASVFLLLVPAVQADEEDAVKWIERMRGKIKRINKPGEGPFVEVVLSYTAVRDGDLKQLTAVRNLRSLDLENTKVTGAGLKALKDLQALSLYRAPVTDAGLKEVKELGNLLTLDLTGTKVTDAGLKHLKALKKLRTLNLSFTTVGDGGLKELKDLKDLQSLRLNRTKVTDAGLKELTGLKDLRSLDLMFTKVTAAGVAELRKSLKRCKVSRLAGIRRSPRSRLLAQLLELLGDLDEVGVDLPQRRPP